MNSLITKNTEQTLSQEEFLQILKHKALFGIRTKNKNLTDLYWCIKDKYTFLCGELYTKQIRDLTDHLVQYYQRGLNKNILVLDNQKNYPILKKFAELANFNYSNKKFVPGTFTNNNLKDFIIPSSIFIVHDKKELQAVSEAIKTKTPILGINNILPNYKLYTKVIIANNFDQCSIGYTLWRILKGLELKKILNLEDLTLEKFLSE